jgi:hypothetical protein
MAQGLAQGMLGPLGVTSPPAVTAEAQAQMAVDQAMNAMNTNVGFQNQNMADVAQAMEDAANAAPTTPGTIGPTSSPSDVSDFGNALAQAMAEAQAEANPSMTSPDDPGAPDGTAAAATGTAGPE